MTYTATFCRTSAHGFMQSQTAVFTDICATCDANESFSILEYAQEALSASWRTGQQESEAKAVIRQVASDVESRFGQQRGRFALSVAYAYEGGVVLCGDICGFDVQRNFQLFGKRTESGFDHSTRLLSLKGAIGQGSDLRLETFALAAGSRTLFASYGLYESTDSSRLASLAEKYFNAGIDPVSVLRSKEGRGHLLGALCLSSQKTVTNKEGSSPSSNRFVLVGGIAACALVFAFGSKFMHQPAPQTAPSSAVVASEAPLVMSQAAEELLIRDAKQARETLAHIRNAYEAEQIQTEMQTAYVNLLEQAFEKVQQLALIPSDSPEWKQFTEIVDDLAAYSEHAKPATDIDLAIAFTELDAALADAKDAPAVLTVDPATEAELSTLRLALKANLEAHNEERIEHEVTVAALQAELDAERALAGVQKTDPAELADANDKVAGLTEQVVRAQLEAAQVKEESSELRLQLANLRSQMDFEKAQGNQSKANNAALNRQLTALEKANAELTAHIDSLGEKNNALRQEAQSAQVAFNQKLSDLSSENASLKSQVAEIEGLKANLTAERTAHESTQKRLVAVQTGLSEQRASLLQLQKMRDALSGELRSLKESQAMLKDHLKQSELIAVADTLPASSPTIARTHKVQAGETLSEISTKVYGTSKRWQDIYEKNRDILSDAKSVRPGQTLVLPE